MSTENTGQELSRLFKQGEERRSALEHIVCPTCGERSLAIIPTGTGLYCTSRTHTGETRLTDEQTKSVFVQIDARYDDSPSAKAARS